MSDDWATRMRAVAAPATDPDDELVAPAPWERHGNGDARIDLQIITNERTGRKLVLIEMDAGDVEVERRIRGLLRVMGRA